MVGHLRNAATIASGVALITLLAASEWLLERKQRHARY